MNSKQDAKQVNNLLSNGSSEHTHYMKIDKFQDIENRIIRLSMLTKMLSVSRSCIYDWINPKSPRHDASFPKKIRLSSRTKGGAVGWRESEVLAWIESRTYH
ncbi:transcriptional regulator, AlpA family [Pseudomonas guineae]|uniref:Transcriptional regulator, AlpA family n=1 Tax=Pseudomonas guineae TaxID=425504 RepID=A0A1I3HCE9_9PSED|nr:AlpA family phage regulatory protein [Pseudomonas guineae]SFI33309.1 transcriptional regulator, AlpA family [Pseudomonas guineae]